MPNEKANIDQLNQSIATLNKEATTVAEIIPTAAKQLGDAVSLGQQYMQQATNAAQSLSDNIKSSGKWQTEFEKSQRATMDSIHSDVSSSMDKLDDIGNRLFASYEDFQRQSNKENEVFRDNIQTALLNNKNDLALRVDAMDTRLNAQVGEMREQITSGMLAEIKKIRQLLYALLGIGALNIALIIWLLFLR